MIPKILEDQMGGDWIQKCVNNAVVLARNGVSFLSSQLQNKKMNADECCLSAFNFSSAYNIEIIGSRQGKK